MLKASIRAEEAMAACAAPCVLGAFKASSQDKVPNAPTSSARLPPKWMAKGAFGRRGVTRLHAKFDHFEGGQAQADAIVQQGDAQGEEDEPEADSVLPGTLEDAVEQSGESAFKFISAGGKRAIVELSVPELGNFDVDGAQQQLWDCSRLFIRSLQSQLKEKRFKAIFPDAGAAALLKYQWGDESFQFGSLNDRRPVSEEDEIIILVSPDYQMLSEVQKITYFLVGDDGLQEKPLIMWNPQLFSGDVGVGLNVRRTRNELLSTFTTVYSLRALPTGAILRRYPGLWQIFLDDKERPGRYLFVKDQARKPNEDDLDRILLGGSTDDPKQQPSFMANAMGVLSSFSRFMRSLSQ